VLAYSKWIAMASADRDRTRPQKKSQKSAGVLQSIQQQADFLKNILPQIITRTRRRCTTSAPSRTEATRMECVRCPDVNISKISSLRNAI